MNYNGLFQLRLKPLFISLKLHTIVFQSEYVTHKTISPCICNQNELKPSCYNGECQASKWSVFCQYSRTKFYYIKQAATWSSLRWSQFATNRSLEKRRWLEWGSAIWLTGFQRCAPANRVESEERIRVTRIPSQQQQQRIEDATADLFENTVELDAADERARVMMHAPSCLMVSQRGHNQLQMNTLLRFETKSSARASVSTSANKEKMWGKCLVQRYVIVAHR